MSHQLAKADEQKLNKGTDPARNKLHAGRGGEHPVPQAGRKRRAHLHVPMVRQTRTEKNNMPKALLLSLMNLALAGMATAQNLLPNGGFEEPPSCGGITGAYTLELATPWFTPNTATPDLYTIDSLSDCGTYLPAVDPNNPGIYRDPFNGNRFAGFYAFNVGDSLKEYCSVPMVVPLVAGHPYRLRIRYQAYSVFRYAVDRLGALFTQAPIAMDGWGMIHQQPQITFVGDPLLDQADGWGLLEDSIVAQGGEAYLTIGSFIPNGELEFGEISGSVYTSAYYLIDGVELEDMTVGIAEHRPAGQLGYDGRNIHWSGLGPLHGLTVQDVVGRVVARYETVALHGSVVVPSSLPAGLYLMRAYADGQYVQSKFIKE